MTDITNISQDTNTATSPVAAPVEATVATPPAAAPVTAHPVLLSQSNEILQYLSNEVNKHTELLALVNSFRSQLDTLHSDLTKVDSFLLKEYNAIEPVVVKTADTVEADVEKAYKAVSNWWNKK